ncbi:enoyl-CoA hydratase/isomerase family protein [Streptantibioticus ferralitis]|uniref:Enoyl-CoA hydratase/isomerase family protein n=1 Tax=Streptantibioticus ferralitis TaxID=236510 RepID=A0ABT5YZZ9_9ACTN|nr:enoyl-CoA hydratase/isomerase family protein [Streptantibioticus ferralitis]MDF2256891.1 enoyl-CoA hydratase/isomerase family protein [Streptantibioticus ferralitis]
MSEPNAPTTAAQADPLLMHDGVRLTVDNGAVATITLCNAAKRNAQSPALWRALVEAGRLLPGSVRVVVLRAEGVSFSAGLDRQAFTPEGFDGEPSFIDLARGSEADLDATIATYQEAFTWWRRNDVVSIAAVQGHAIGAGFQLALACDLRVCADDVQFAMRETSLGLVPDLAGTKPLTGLVGYARALEICATGRYVHAEEAESTGLANLVVPSAELDSAVQDLAAALLAAPRDAVIETKALLRDAASRTYEEQCAAERAAQGRRLRDLAGVGE